MVEIQTLTIHQFKDGRKRVTLGEIDLSHLVSDVEIDIPVSPCSSAKLLLPVVKPVFTYEE
jgi:hypothetical protein